MVAIIGRKIPTTGVTGAQAGGLGDSFSRIAAALANPLIPALRREKLIEAERQNVGTSAVAARDFTDPNLDVASVISDSIRAGLDPKYVSGMRQFGVVQREGPETANATKAILSVPGSQPGQTFQGFREDLANRRGIARMQNETALTADSRKPTLVLRNGVPTWERQSEAYGQPASVPLTQQQGAVLAAVRQQPGGIAGADAPTRRMIGAGDPQLTPRNYVIKGTGENVITYDGTTDARTGEPLPPGHLAGVQGSATDVGIRPNVQSGLQNAELARGRFKLMLGYTRKIAESDPTLFGVTGRARNLFQEGVQLAGNVAQMFGGSNIRDAQEKVRNSAISAGVNPALVKELFDPNLPALTAAANLLVYQGAAALAGQEGRDVSDKDAAIMRNTFGDPQALLSSRESFLARLQAAEDIVDLMAKADRQFRERQAPRGAAPSGAMQPGAVKTIRIDREGNIIQ